MRLKVLWETDGWDPSLFLFQTGAIKSMCVKCASTCFDWFLFQTGAIKSFIAWVFTPSRPRFLFQTGAIKSGAVGHQNVDPDTLFLFQTGAIKRTTPNLPC